MTENIFDPATNFQVTFYLPSLYKSKQKKHADWLSCSWDIVIYESCDLIRREHFYPCKTKTYKPSFTFFQSRSITEIIKLIHWFLLGIQLIQKFCSLIGWEHFWPRICNYMPRINQFIFLSFLRYSWLRFLQSWFIKWLLWYSWFKNHVTSFTFLLSIFACTPEVKLIHLILLEMSLIQEFCNLIYLEFFWPYPTKNLQTNFYVSWIYNFMPRIKLIYLFFWDI